MKIKLSTPYGTFLQGGRLTDLHKNNIDTHELLTKLNEIAKEKVNALEKPRKECEEIHG